MPRSVLLSGGIILITALVQLAHGDTTSRGLSLYTSADQLYILGRELPYGDDLTVRLGDEYLEVISATESLVVVDLPARLPAGDLSLVMQEGVERIVVDKPALTWGLRMPPVPDQR